MYIPKDEDFNDPKNRAKLCTRWDIDPQLLVGVCNHDLDPFVVKFAALNPITPVDSVRIALSRFPELNTDRFWLERDERYEKYINGDLNSTGDRDQIILQHVIFEDKKINGVDHAGSHLGNLTSNNNFKFVNPSIEWAPTEKFRIAMIMPPAWGIIFPPYSTARLTALLRKFDYSVKVYDLNIECYHAFKSMNSEIDYWRSERYYAWSNKDNFYKWIFPVIKPILDKTVEEIINSKVRVVGLSLYNTNQFAAQYIVMQIKSLNPAICIMIGGPEAMNQGVEDRIFSNYFFIGEAEESFIETLENLTEDFPVSEFVGSMNSKLPLEKYPYADYSDYNLSNYQHDAGISIETSRGCVAQCSFCAETYFWRFRSLTPERVVEEMEYQIHKHNIERFWFVDSLVNGNIKNFEKLVDLIIENDLDIKWNSYARCDGRMTESFLKKVKNSGCSALSFGVESGSQKVLLDMRKKIEIWEIENNLRDCSKVGIVTHVNWIVGFPTETPIDFLHSLCVIFNTRKYIDAISTGFGASPSPHSHMETDPEVYKLLPQEDDSFCATWYTEHYRNTILHRYIRIKFLHVWLEILKDKRSKVTNTQRYHNIKKHYTFKDKQRIMKPTLSYETCIKLNRYSSDTLQESVANEYMTMIFSLWSAFEACNFEIVFDPELDLSTFGSMLTNNYSAKFSFSIDKNGNYSYTGTHTFLHHALTSDKEFRFIKETKKENKSFSFDFADAGNISEWKVSESQIDETIHENYRIKQKKTIPIITV